MKLEYVRSKVMNALTQLFSHSTDAVFGIDKAGYVSFWNKRCERLLGYSQNEAIGKSCAQVFCGTDLHGKPFCGKQCSIAKKVPGQSDIDNYDLIVKRADGDSIWVNIGAHYVIPELQKKNIDSVIFFGLRRVNCQRLLQRMASESQQRSNGNGISQYSLTPREMKILTLAATGLNTAKIADDLYISTQTVRNHFKSIYPKLDVHSRAEAIILAMRHNLIQRRLCD